jgi:hypothetical protein
MAKHLLSDQRIRNSSCPWDVDVGAASVSLHIAEAKLSLRLNLARYVVTTLEAWQISCDD